jgi:hypothetical protein
MSSGSDRKIECFDFILFSDGMCEILYDEIVAANSNEWYLTIPILFNKDIKFKGIMLKQTALEYNL